MVSRSLGSAELVRICSPGSGGQHRRFPSLTANKSSWKAFSSYLITAKVLGHCQEYKNKQMTVM